MRFSQYFPLFAVGLLVRWRSGLCLKYWKGDFNMKMFNVTFNKTGEYGDMYEESNEAVFLADNIEDIVEYLKKTYLPNGEQKTLEEMIILSHDVEDFSPYVIHEILVYEINIKPITDKISYLG